MGPDTNALDQVKRDAITTTMRHFRDEVEDEKINFKPKADLEKARAQLLAEQDATPSDTPDTTESTPDEKKSPAPAKGAK